MKIASGKTTARVARAALCAIVRRNEEFNTFHTFVVQVDRRDELQGLAEGPRHQDGDPLSSADPSAAGGPRGSATRRATFPVTERQADRILTLPVNQYMSQADVETVAGEVMAFLDRS